jgi:hypothetical protein
MGSAKPVLYPMCVLPNPNPPIAHPHPIQQAALLDMDKEATDAPAASGSSLAVPAAQRSIPT